MNAALSPQKSECAWLFWQTHEYSSRQAMKRSANTGTLVLASITIFVLVLSAPASLREAYDRGGFYLFSQAFIEGIPKTLSGPGRFRFILQPLTAIVLGIGSGIGDARIGRRPYLVGMVFDRKLRYELLRSGFTTIANLLLMGILLDSVFQWIILGTSHPGAALIVGPLLVAAPYSLARALANRCARLRTAHEQKTRRPNI